MRIAMLCPKCEEGHYAERCPNCGHGEVVELPQYSPSWWMLRIGVPTASCFKMILTADKALPSTSRKKYIAELCADILKRERGVYTPKFFSERGTGRPLSKSIERGNNFEEEARRWYQMERGGKIRQPGFCLSDCGRFGCSPDVLAEDDAGEGGCEIKVDELETQVEAAFFAERTLPLDHKAQVHGSMIVTGRQWWDYLGYCPERPDLSILIRVTADEYTAKLRAALEEFWMMYQAVRGKMFKLAEGEVLEPAF